MAWSDVISPTGQKTRLKKLSGLTKRSRFNCPVFDPNARGATYIAAKIFLCFWGDQISLIDARGECFHELFKCFRRSGRRQIRSTERRDCLHSVRVKLGKTPSEHAAPIVAHDHHRVFDIQMFQQTVQVSRYYIGAIVFLIMRILQVCSAYHWLGRVWLLYLFSHTAKRRDDDSKTQLCKEWYLVAPAYEKVYRLINQRARNSYLWFINIPNQRSGQP